MTNVPPQGHDTPPPEGSRFAPLEPPRKVLRVALAVFGGLSILGGAGAVVLATANLMGAELVGEPWQRALALVVISGAVGFGTNWLAIRMLFRPRRPKPWIPFWPLGLLPREQGRLAHALGHVAAERLLSPEAVARVLGDPRVRHPLGQALRDEVSLVLDAPETRELLAQYAAEGIRRGGPEVIRQLRGPLRRALEQELERNVSPERLAGWLKHAVHGFAASEDARRTVAKWIFEESTREGVLSRIIAVLQEQFMRYRERHPVRGFLAEQFVIDWDELRGALADTLRTEEATEEMTDALVDVSRSLAEKLSQEGAIEPLLVVRRRLVNRVLDWFETDGVSALATRFSGLGDHPRTWEYVHAALDDLIERVPEALFAPDGSVRPEIRGHLAELQARLVNLFPVADIVERQVLAMDPAKLEALVDDVAQKELAWIQILGFILGAMAGVLLGAITW